MNDAMWQRHANRWSVWTRLATVPLFALVVYARIWLGWWTVAWLAAIAAWLWLNVRVFPPERSDARWEARAIFGEKIWFERCLPLPHHHLQWIFRLNLASSLFVLPMAWGLWTRDLWATAFGTAGMVGGQLWVLDRYAWLYADVTRNLNDDKRAASTGGAAGDGDSQGR